MFVQENILNRIIYKKKSSFDSNSDSDEALLGFVMNGEFRTIGFCDRSGGTNVSDMCSDEEMEVGAKME
jgi:hypothetical protein